MLHKLLASISVTTCFGNSPPLFKPKWERWSRKGRLLSEVKMERGQRSYMGKEGNRWALSLGNGSREEGRWDYKFVSKIRISEESREEETLGIAFGDLERDEITWTNGWIQRMKRERGHFLQQRRWIVKTRNQQWWSRWPCLWFPITDWWCILSLPHFQGERVMNKPCSLKTDWAFTIIQLKPFACVCYFLLGWILADVKEMSFFTFLQT